MRRLEFAPKSPFHNIQETVRKIREARPGITDHGVDQAVKMMLDSGRPKGYKPRTKGRFVYLFGRDIMTAHLDQIPAWQFISPEAQRRLLEHPIEGGIRLEDRLSGEEDQKQTELIRQGLVDEQYRAGVNRSVFISHRDLAQTYSWCFANNWLQEVTDAEYDLILSMPGMRQKFRDPDIHGPYQDVRSYDGPGVVTQTHIAPASDTNYILRQLKAAPSWQGTDLPKS